MARFYTGVGSGTTPPEIEPTQRGIAQSLRENGFVLRSGGADGSDTFFENGAGDAKEVFYGNPRHKHDGEYREVPTGPQQTLIRNGALAKRAEEIVAQILQPSHWQNIVKKGAFVKNLHRRNAFQVLGPKLDDPVEFLVCWAKPDARDKSVQGGTKTAYKLAAALEIPVFNIAIPADLERFRDFARAGYPTREPQALARTLSRMADLGIVSRESAHARAQAAGAELPITLGRPVAVTMYENFPGHAKAQQREQRQQAAQGELDLPLPGPSSDAEFTIGSIFDEDAATPTTTPVKARTRPAPREAEPTTPATPAPAPRETRTASTSKTPRIVQEPPLAQTLDTSERLSADLDGVTHINVYSKAKTALGRGLSNFAKTPFECEHGRFESVEGLWYWLGSDHPDRDRLRTLSGFQAKDTGRQLRGPDWNNTPEFIAAIKAGIDAKLAAHPQLLEALRRSTLPLRHYYVFGGAIKEPAEGRWVIEHLEAVRQREREASQEQRTQERAPDRREASTARRNETVSTIARTAARTAMAVENQRFNRIITVTGPLRMSRDQHEALIYALDKLATDGTLIRTGAAAWRDHNPTDQVVRDHVEQLIEDGRDVGLEVYVAPGLGDGDEAEHATVINTAALNQEISEAYLRAVDPYRVRPRNEEDLTRQEKRNAFPAMVLGKEFDRPSSLVIAVGKVDQKQMRGNGGIVYALGHHLGIETIAIDDGRIRESRSQIARTAERGIPASPRAARFELGQGPLDRQIERARQSATARTADLTINVHRLHAGLTESLGRPVEYVGRFPDDQLQSIDPQARRRGLGNPIPLDDRRSAEARENNMRSYLEFAKSDTKTQDKVRTLAEEAIARGTLDLACHCQPDLCHAHAIGHEVAEVARARGLTVATNFASQEQTVERLSQRELRSNLTYERLRSMVDTKLSLQIQNHPELNVKFIEGEEPRPGTVIEKLGDYVALQPDREPLGTVQILHVEQDQAATLRLNDHFEPALSQEPALDLQMETEPNP